MTNFLTLYPEAALECMGVTETDYYLDYKTLVHRGLLKDGWNSTSYSIPDSLTSKIIIHFHVG